MLPKLSQDNEKPRFTSKLEIFPALVIIRGHHHSLGSELTVRGGGICNCWVNFGSCPPLMTHELPLPLKMSLPKFIIAEEGGRETETLQQFEIRTSNFPPEQSSSEDRRGRQKSRFYHHFVCLNGPSCSAVRERERESLSHHA